MSSIFFSSLQGRLDPAEGHASGQNAATITPVTGGGDIPDRILSIDFQAGRVDVFGVPANGGLEALGPSITIFNPPRFTRDGEPATGFGEPGLVPWEDFGIGSYQWTGLRDQPDTFSVTLSSPGSGPDPRREFFGVGVRHAEASEPGTLAVLALGLGAAIWARRRLR
jgi:hypothetical protein